MASHSRHSATEKRWIRPRQWRWVTARRSAVASCSRSPTELAMRALPRAIWEPPRPPRFAPWGQNSRPDSPCRCHRNGLQGEPSLQSAPLKGTAGPGVIHLLRSTKASVQGRRPPAARPRMSGWQTGRQRTRTRTRRLSVSAMRWDRPWARTGLGARSASPRRRSHRSPGVLQSWGSHHREAPQHRRQPRQPRCRRSAPRPPDPYRRAWLRKRRPPSQHEPESVQRQGCRVSQSDCHMCPSRTWVQWTGDTT